MESLSSSCLLCGEMVTLTLHRSGRSDAVVWHTTCLGTMGVVGIVIECRLEGNGEAGWNSTHAGKGGWGGGLQFTGHMHTTHMKIGH